MREYPIEHGSNQLMGCVNGSNFSANVSRSKAAQILAEGIVSAADRVPDTLHGHRGRGHLASGGTNDGYLCFAQTAADSVGAQGECKTYQANFGRGWLALGLWIHLCARLAQAKDQQPVVPRIEHWFAIVQSRAKVHKTCDGHTPMTTETLRLR